QLTAHGGDELFILVTRRAATYARAGLAVGDLLFAMGTQGQCLLEGVDCRLRNGGFDRNAHTVLALRHCANLLPRSPVRNVPAGSPWPVSKRLNVQVKHSQRRQHSVPRIDLNLEGGVWPQMARWAFDHCAVFLDQRLRLRHAVFALTD